MAGSQTRRDPLRRLTMPVSSLLGIIVLTVAASATWADPPTKPKAGTESVEELLNRCRADGVIVPVRNTKTNELDKDPQLGIPRFTVPDHAKLAATIKANRALMEPEKSRQAL